jgi:hypothetical protein
VQPLVPSPRPGDENAWPDTADFGRRREMLAVTESGPREGTHLNDNERIRMLSLPSGKCRFAAEVQSSAQ